MKLSLASRVVICNHVIMSTLWFFITMWAGSNKTLRKIWSAIHNYRSSGNGQLNRTRVTWKECWIKGKYDGLGLVDPEDAKTNILYQWVMKAMEPREPNLQLMVRYWLGRFSPNDLARVGEAKIGLVHE